MAIPSSLHTSLVSPNDFHTYEIKYLVVPEDYLGVPGSLYMFFPVWPHCINLTLLGTFLHLIFNVLRWVTRPNLNYNCTFLICSTVKAEVRSFIPDVRKLISLKRLCSLTLTTSSSNTMEARILMCDRGHPQTFYRGILQLTDFF